MRVMANPSDISQLAVQARINLLRTIYDAKAAHIASSLSCIEIFLAGLMLAEKTDDLIVSKGHAAAGFYSCLTVLGRMTEKTLSTYGENGSLLFGHVSKETGHGIPFSTGSLGHGLPYGVGRALGRKRRVVDGNIVVICSDGEMDEGTTWESALLASHHKLSNLRVVIDRNRIQSIGSTEETLALEPLADKWIAFGWEIDEVDGHDPEALIRSLSPKSTQKPVAVIAHTTKGKGVSWMENNNIWHYKPPSAKEFEAALKELGESE